MGKSVSFPTLKTRGGERWGSEGARPLISTPTTLALSRRESEGWGSGECLSDQGGDEVGKYSTQIGGGSCS